MNKVLGLYRDENIERLIKTVESLGSLSDEFVFVGGAVLSLYRTKEIPDPYRTTKDVDVVAEVFHMNDYYEYDEKLRHIGFLNEKEDGVIVRYVKDNDLVLDLLPHKSGVFGDTNKWFEEGVKNTETRELSETCSIRILNLSFYLCTKIKAYSDRGRIQPPFADDKQTHDMEDIILLLRCLKKKEDILIGPKFVVSVIEEFFRKHIHDHAFLNYLDTQFYDDEIGQDELVAFLRRI